MAGIVLVLEVVVAELSVDDTPAELEIVETGALSSTTSSCTIYHDIARERRSVLRQRRPS